jgi:3-hydroxyacyl-CoA dehydrogenase
MTINNLTVAGAGTLGSQIAFQTALSGDFQSIFGIRILIVPKRG